MSLTIVYFWFSIVYFVHAQNTDDRSSCEPSNFRYTYMNGSNIDFIETCKNTICMIKCCPPSQVLIFNETSNTLPCVNTNLITPDDWKIDIYDMNIKQNVKKSERKFKEFTLVYGDQFSNSNCSELIPVDSIYPRPEHTIYILEDGSFIVRRPNYFNHWISNQTMSAMSPGRFCVDHVIVKPRNNVSRNWTIKVLFDGDGFPDSYWITYTAYGMLVSCVFLVLVLCVYAVLPQLRNLAGMMLMAYVATLTVGFVFRAVLVIGMNNEALTKNECLFVGFMFYYATLASFTWMNVMSFDIWWSMRGFRNMHQMPRHGALVKFAWYSLYGWGAPLVPVLFMVIVDPMDLTEQPNFIKPHIMDKTQCFIEEDERLLYMNGAILITTCINITLFLMTAYNIWRIKQGVSQHSAGESRRNKKEKNRFAIYLKLSLVMGTNWILEVVSSVYKADSVLWYAPDVFNCLVGLFIFIIFICKKHIIVLLCKRFSTGKAIIDILQPIDSTRTLSSRLNKDGKY